MREIIAILLSILSLCISAVTLREEPTETNFIPITTRVEEYSVKELSENPDLVMEVYHKYGCKEILKYLESK